MIFKNRQHHISTLILFTILILTNHQNGQHGHSNEHEHDYDRGPGWGPQDHCLLPSDGWAENFLNIYFVNRNLHSSISLIENFIYRVHKHLIEAGLIQSRYITYHHLQYTACNDPCISIFKIFFFLLELFFRLAVILSK